MRDTQNFSSFLLKAFCERTLANVGPLCPLCPATEACSGGLCVSPTPALTKTWPEGWRPVHKSLVSATFEGMQLCSTGNAECFLFASAPGLGRGEKTEQTNTADPIQQSAGASDGRRRHGAKLQDGHTARPRQTRTESDR